MLLPFPSQKFALCCSSSFKVRLIRGKKSHFSVGQRGKQWLITCIVGGVSRSRYLLIPLALCRKKMVLSPAGGGVYCPRFQMHRMCLLILLGFGEPMFKSMGASHLALFRIFRFWAG